MRVMKGRLLMALRTGVSLVGHGFAQSSDVAVRLGGRVDSLSGNTLHLTMPSGDKATAVLAGNPRLNWLIRATPTDIANGSDNGTAAIPQCGRTLRSLEVQVVSAQHGRQ